MPSVCPPLVLISAAFVTCTAPGILLHNMVIFAVRYRIIKELLLKIDAILCSLDNPYFRFKIRVGYIPNRLIWVSIALYRYLAYYGVIVLAAYSLVIPKIGGNDHRHLTSGP